MTAQHSLRTLALPATLILVLVAGCAGDSPPQITDPQGWTEMATIPRQQIQLAEFDGWRIWELTNGNLITCMAIKPLPGTPWPDLTTGTFWPRMADAWSAHQRMIKGDGGFFMYFINRSDIPYFGFYGKKTYRLPPKVTVAGQPVFDTNDRATVLSWEGKDVAFRILTQPVEDNPDGAVETGGTLDFTGVTRAFELLNQCHTRFRY